MHKQLSPNLSVLSKLRALSKAALSSNTRRLTPAYAYVLFVSATLWLKTSEGPLNHQHAVTVQETCGSFWWTNLLYVNNLYPTNLFKEVRRGGRPSYLVPAPFNPAAFLTTLVSRASTVLRSQLVPGERHAVLRALAAVVLRFLQVSVIFCFLSAPEFSQ